MKLIRLLALGGLAVAFAAPALQAQGGGGGGRGRGGVQMLLEGITLDSAQTAKVAEIQAKYRAEMPAFNRDAPPDSAAQAKRRELMQKQQADVRAVLTPDQQKLWDENLGKMRRPPGQ